MPFYIFDFLPYVFGIHVCELVAPLVPLLTFHYEKLFLGFLLGCPEFSLLLAVGLALKVLVRRLTSAVHFLASGGRKERGDLKGLGVDRGIAKVAASDRSCNI